MSAERKKYLYRVRAVYDGGAWVRTWHYQSARAAAHRKYFAEKGLDAGLADRPSIPPADSVTVERSDLITWPTPAVA